MHTINARKLSWAVAGVILATSIASGEPDLVRPADAPVRASRVRLRATMHAAAVTRALAGARRRMQRPGCQRLFTDFQDEGGRPLREALERYGASGEEYLDRLVFYDGTHQAICDRKAVLAYTSPGNQVVFVCSPQFTRAAFADPRLAEAALIHESLHSLGLGENPPTSREITARVLSRCRS